MRKLPVFVLALLFGLTSIGCDSAEDDPSDAEVFVGTWNLVSLSDDEGNQTAAFTQVANSFRAEMTRANTITVTVDYKDEVGLTDLVIPGTYSVVEADKKLILTPPAGPSVPFDYVIENDSRIQLSTDAVFINGLFGTDAYVGTVVIVIERVS